MIPFDYITWNVAEAAQYVLDEIVPLIPGK